jgi:hypothetical protein
MKGGYEENISTSVDKALLEFKKYTKIDYYALPLSHFIDLDPDIEFQNFLLTLCFPIEGKITNRTVDSTIIFNKIMNPSYILSSTLDDGVFTFVYMRAIVHVVIKEITDCKNKKILMSNPTLCVQLFFKYFLNSSCLSFSSKTGGAPPSIMTLIKKWFSKSNSKVSPIFVPKLNEGTLILINNYINSQYKDDIVQINTSDRIACPFLMIPQYDQPVCLYISYLTIILTNTGFHEKIKDLVEQNTEQLQYLKNLFTDSEWDKKASCVVNGDNVKFGKETREVPISTYVLYLIHPLFEHSQKADMLVDAIKKKKAVDGYIIKNLDEVQNILNFDFDVFKFTISLMLLDPQRFPTFFNKQRFDPIYKKYINNYNVNRKISSMKIPIDFMGSNWCRNLLQVLFNVDVPLYHNSKQPSEYLFVINPPTLKTSHSLTSIQSAPAKRQFSCFKPTDLYDISLDRKISSVENGITYEQGHTYKCIGASLISLTRNCIHVSHAIALIRDTENWYLYNGWQPIEALTMPLTRTNIAHLINLTDIHGDNYMQYKLPSYTPTMQIFDLAYNPICNGDHTYDYTLDNNYFALFRRDTVVPPSTPVMPPTPVVPTITTKDIEYFYSATFLIKEQLKNPNEINVILEEGFQVKIISSAVISLSMLDTNLDKTQVNNKLESKPNSIIYTIQDETLDDFSSKELLEYIKRPKTSYNIDFDRNTSFKINNEFVFVTSEDKSMCTPYVQAAINANKMIQNFNASTEEKDLLKIYTNVYNDFSFDFNAMHMVCYIWLLLLLFTVVSEEKELAILYRSYAIAKLSTSISGEIDFLKTEVAKYACTINDKVVLNMVSKGIFDFNSDLILNFIINKKKQKGGKKIKTPITRPTMMEYYKRYSPHYYKYLKRKIRAREQLKQLP